MNQGIRLAESKPIVKIREIYFPPEGSEITVILLQFQEKSNYFPESFGLSGCLFSFFSYTVSHYPLEGTPCFQLFRLSTMNSFLSYYTVPQTVLPFGRNTVVWKLLIVVL